VLGKKSALMQAIWSKYDKRPDVSQLRVAWRNTEMCLVCVTCKLTSILSQADDQNGYSTALNEKKIVIHSFRTNMFDLFSNGQTPISATDF